MNGWNRKNGEALFAALSDIKEMELAISSVTNDDVVPHRIPAFLEFLAEALMRRGVHVSGSPTTVSDPAFHEPSYDAGFQDGNNDIEADYNAALTEIPGFDWPADRDFGPDDVAAVLAMLAKRGA